MEDYVIEGIFLWKGIHITLMLVRRAKKIGFVHEETET